MVLQQEDGPRPALFSRCGVTAVPISFPRNVNT